MGPLLMSCMSLQQRKHSLGLYIPAVLSFFPGLHHSAGLRTYRCTDVQSVWFSPSIPWEVTFCHEIEVSAPFMPICMGSLSGIGRVHAIATLFGDVPSCIGNLPCAAAMCSDEQRYSLSRSRERGLS